MLDEDLQNLAAEYALGTLGALERARAEALCAENTEFARLVAQCEGQLAPLSEALPSQVPPATVWSKIEEALKDAVAIPSIDIAQQLSELRERLSMWRYVATGALAATVLLAVVTANSIVPGLFGVGEKRHFVAMLMDDGGKYGFIITVAPENEKIMIRKVAYGAPPSKFHELWLIKPDGSPPASLGMLNGEKLLTVDVSDKVPMDDFADGVKLAVSVEPLGGAPSGNAMGPVVFAGLLMKQMP